MTPVFGVETTRVSESSPAITLWVCAAVFSCPSSSARAQVFHTNYLPVFSIISLLHHSVAYLGPGIVVDLFTYLIQMLGDVVPFVLR